MKRIMTAILAILLAAGVAAGVSACAAIGNSPAEETMTRYETSPNYESGVFVNAAPFSLDVNLTLSEKLGFFFNTSRKPSSPLPVSPITAADFPKRPGDLQAVWLGHSTTLLDIDGVRLLMDPVFGNASPVPFTVNRFQDAPIDRDNLPLVDAVVISHDHYDHLEMKTIKALAGKAPLFIVPLGVGSHLEKWGCPPDKIIELDWWQSHTVNGVDIVAAPSRHFSGRSFGDRGRTLWASFAFKGPRHSAYYSGDGGFDGRFKEIGERLGPFDLTILENGAWNTAWPDVHLFPEETLQAHQELGGRYLLPVHWAAYDLSFHRWDDPIRIISRQAAEQEIALLTPKMGDICIPGQTVHGSWWESVTP